MINSGPIMTFTGKLEEIHPPKVEGFNAIMKKLNRAHPIPDNCFKIYIGTFLFI